MVPFLRPLAASLSVVALLSLAVPPSQARPRTRGAGSYIVVLDERADPAEVAEAHADLLGLRIGNVYSHALKGYSARLKTSAARRLRRLPGVLWVERDRRVALQQQVTPTGIDRVEADVSATAAIDGNDTELPVDVAVIDTGIDLDHPDLNVYEAGGANCVTAPTPPDDLNGHGTHVAGTIAARDDDRGVVGVAPGARLWPVKVLSHTGSGFMSWVVCGVDHVTAHAGEVEVANVSLIGLGRDDGACGSVNHDALHRAICASVAAGVTYAVAAGNYSRAAGAFVPAAYDEVITVSALADFDGAAGARSTATCKDDRDDTFADFSNFGSDIDLIAPGVCIRSTFVGGGYRSLSGTSMASPHVAGAAGLFIAQNPDATPAEVRERLVAAGSSEWLWPSQDRDATKEPLLDCTTL